MLSSTRFLLPALVFASLLPIAEADSGYSFKDQSGQHLDVLRDGKVIARYMYAHDTSSPARKNETYKPYLHVFDAAGAAPITKGAGGSFPHHRGIYLGWAKIGVEGKPKTYDRWHMKGGDQIHEKFLAQKAENDRASFTSLVRWTGDTLDATILEEERTLSFLPPPAPGYALIDMDSKVKAVAGATSLDGDPEHSGLHFRPAEEVDRSQTAYLYPKEKAEPHKDKDYPWFGETFSLKGKRYSVVYLNHPGNPKGAAISAYRDYGRFGAFWKAQLPANGTQQIRARFLVAEGDMPSAEVIQKAWNEYAGASDPTPATTAKGGEYKKSPDSKKKPAATPSPAKPPKPAATFSPVEENEFIQVAAEARPAAAKAPAAKPSPATPAPATPEPGAAAAAGAPESKGPKRAGGGPENPEIKFKLPPPPTLTPQEALKTFKLAPGFRIEAVATEPMIEAPIALSWDDQGRMFVLEMIGYMHDVDGAGEDQPIGRVSRLEDTNGDGVMDKSTVFADKLVMPRAVMALGDGALIGVPPNLTYYRDTNGDGVADKTEPVNDKYGTAGGQPEHMANSPTWMLDNWIWSSNHGNRYRYQQGKFVTEQVSGFGQWGRTQDDWGRQYFNYNSDFLRTDLVPPTYYTRNPRLSDKLAINFQVVKDQAVWPAGPTPGVNRGYSGILRDDGTLKNCTATCGAAIYRGDLFPAEYRGNAFIPEPSGNLVKRMIVSESDAVLKGTNAGEGTEFLTSTDERFRPVNAYTGPDGALYIVDMARGILQHKGFLTYYLVANIKDRNLEQPVNLGRVYRIVPEGAKPATVKLPRDTAKVVASLAHANGWVRDTAQRVIVERADAAVVPAVKKLSADAATPQGRAQALWTLEGLKALTPEIIKARLADADEHVRAAAVRLADSSSVPELIKLTKDPSAQVRMHLAFRLSGEPGVDEALVALLQSENVGPILGDAVASGLAGRELEFLEALAKLPAESDEKLAGSRIFQTLAACVMQERRGPRVAQLLTLIAAQPADSPRQLALLTGMAGKDKSGAKGSTTPNAVKLDALPPALATLQNATTHPKAKPLVAKVEQQLAWPGKAGVAAAVKAKPLTPAQQALFDKGKTIYATICGACHQPTGAGMAGLAPPLLNSEWAIGPAERPIRIVLQGMTGPIEIHGTKWQLEMPGLPTLSDEDVAGVLTYIRREWEHSASPVMPADVAKERAATKERTKAWTAEELTKLVEPKGAKAK